MFSKFSYLALTIVVVTTSVASTARADSGVTGRVAGQGIDGKYIGMVPGATIEVLKPGGEVTATTTANAHGMFKIQLPPGQYFYRVRAEGYKDEDAGRGFEIERGDQMESFHLSLTKGENDPDRVPVVPPESTHGTLIGRVVEEIAGVVHEIRFARITLVNETTRQVVEVDARPRGGVAGVDDGEFRTSLPAGIWRGSVRATGYDRYVDPKPIVIEVDETTARTFKLRRYEPPAEMLAMQGIRGEVVVEKAGRTYSPPFAVTIRAIGKRDRAVAHTETIAPGAGSFSFNLLPGGYQVVASAADTQFAKAVSPPTYVFPGRFSNVRLVMREKPEELRIVDMETIQPEQTITPDPQPDGAQPDSRPDQLGPQPEPPDVEIVALDRLNKQPLIGTEVLLREVSDQKATVIRGLTDASGIARFKIPAGRYFVVARLAGFEVVAATPVENFSRGRLLLDIQAKRNNRATFVLGRNREPEVTRDTGLVIQVEDEKAGSPVVGASVAIARAMLKPRILTTGTTGEVRVPEAVAGRYSIRITHPEYITVGRDIDFDPANPRHDFAMYRRATYTDRDIAMSRSSHPIVPGGAELLAVQGWVVTPKYESKQPSITNRIVPRTLRPAGQPDWTQVQPVAGADVLWYWPGTTSGAGGDVLPGAVRRVRTDSRGQFRISSVAENAYRVVVRAVGYRDLDTRVSVRRGMSDPVLTLTPSASGVRQDDQTALLQKQLSIQVVDQRRRIGVPEATVSILRAGKPLRTGTTDKQGIFRTRVPQGSYQIKASGENITPGGTQANVTNRDINATIMVQRTSGGTTPGNVTPGTVTPGTVIPGTVTPSQSNYPLSVHVVDRRRQGVVGATVVVMRGNQTIKSGQTNGQGFYRTTVPSGNYFLKASGSKINPGGTQVSVQNRATNATVSVTQTQPSSSQTGPPQVQLKYLAQYRAPGSKTWSMIGSYGDRKSAESAVKRAKLPPKSETRVVPQSAPTQRRGITIPRRSFSTGPR